MDELNELREDLQAFQDHVHEEMTAFNTVAERVTAAQERLADDFTEMSETLDELGTGLSETSQQLVETAQRLDETAERLDETAQRLDETAQRLDETAQRLDRTSYKVSELSVRLAYTATETKENTAAIKQLKADSEERWRQLAGRQRLNEGRVTRVLEAAERVDVNRRCDEIEARLSEVEKRLQIDPPAA